MMKTRIMFIRDTEPLVRAHVRVRGVSDAFTTDEHGQIEVDLDPGEHDFEVFREDSSWTTRTIDTRTSSASLLVINVSASTDPALDRTRGGFIVEELARISGRYEYKGLLGQGGMGVVFKAYDALLERDVAIKVLNEELRFNEEAQRIFLDEARSLATLKHPNLVTIHDVTEVDNVAMIVTEFIAGKNLDEQVRRAGPMDEHVVIKIAHQLTHALDYMHRQGVIHRDIKPGNLIIREDGSLKVVDFGLARSLQQIMMRGTRRRGTPAYMAPEQIEGGELTARTDLYQMGTTLYELLSGYLPFESSDMAYAHVHTEPRPIVDLVPNISFGMAELIHKCLAKDPGARPASAADIIPALDRLRLAGKGDATQELQIMGRLRLEREPDPSLVGLEPTVRPASVTPADVSASLATGMNSSMSASGAYSASEDNSHKKILAALALILLLAGAIVAILVAQRISAPERSNSIVAVTPEPEVRATIEPVIKATIPIPDRGAQESPATTPFVEAREAAPVEPEAPLERAPEPSEPPPRDPPAREATPEREDSPPEKAKAVKAKRAPALEEPEEKPREEVSEELIDLAPDASEKEEEVALAPEPETTPAASKEPEEAEPEEEEPEEKVRKIIRKKVIKKKAPARKIPRSF